METGNFSIQLSPDNPWFRMAQLIPWSEIERKFSRTLCSTDRKCSYPLRMMLGALIIWDYYDLSDVETMEHIRDNPYLQFFLGLNEYQKGFSFDFRMLLQFRQKVSLEMLREINDMLPALLYSSASGDAERGAMESGCMVMRRN